MTARSAVIALIALTATLAPRIASAVAGAVPGVSARWVESTGAVEVMGLDQAERDRLARLDSASDRWDAVFSVRVARATGQPEASPIVGRREVVGAVVQFTPRYPFLPGKRYVARFVQAGSPSIEVEFTPPVPTPGAATAVLAVYPSAEVLPENVLKLYLKFTAPMSRGEVYRRVRLIDAGGRAIDRPFLEIGEELWNPAMTRLTLLFDPGRIKRGLKPREEEGPILVEGSSYTFVIDRDWPDAEGRPLRAGHRKAFRAGPPDETQPDPKRWSFDVPPAGSSLPLVVGFPEPLDRAMLDRCLVVVAGGDALTGRAEIGAGERSWRFVPDAPWPARPLAVRVDVELEDLAGNSVARPFEVDVIRDEPNRPSSGWLTIPLPGKR